MRLSILLVVLMIAQQACAQRVFTLNKTALHENKRKIERNNPDKLPAYTQLIKDAKKSLQFGPVSVMEKKHLPPSGDRHDYMSLAPYHWPDPSKPDGLPYIRKDGQTNPEVREYKDKEYQPALCEHVYTLALAYYFTEDNVYAEHATRLLKVWFLDTARRSPPSPAPPPNPSGPAPCDRSTPARSSPRCHR